jgi:hypothetical protein
MLLIAATGLLTLGCLEEMLEYTDRNGGFLNLEISDIPGSLCLVAVPSGSVWCMVCGVWCVVWGGEDQMFGSTRRCSEEAVIWALLAAGWLEYTTHHTPHIHTQNDPSLFWSVLSFESYNNNTIIRRYE